MTARTRPYKSWAWLALAACWAAVGLFAWVEGYWLGVSVAPIWVVICLLGSQVADLNDDRRRAFRILRDAFREQDGPRP